MSQKNHLFEIELAEVWHSTIRIRAKDAEEARKFAREGQGEHLHEHFVYSHTLEEIPRVTKVSDASES